MFCPSGVHQVVCTPKHRLVRKLIDWKRIKITVKYILHRCECSPVTSSNWTYSQQNYVDCGCNGFLTHHRDSSLGNISHPNIQHIALLQPYFALSKQCKYCCSPAKLLCSCFACISSFDSQHWNPVIGDQVSCEWNINTW